MIMLGGLLWMAMLLALCGLILLSMRVIGVAYNLSAFVAVLSWDAFAKALPKVAFAIQIYAGVVLIFWTCKGLYLIVRWVAQ